MKLNFEQVFYGRGINGYGILGVSPAAGPHVARAESLCRAVGTPSVDYGGEPFLMSVPEGDCVIMVCGRRGVPDSMGRSTLFFHALVADRKAMADANTDAFSLFSQNMFTDKMPAGNIAPLDIDIKPSKDMVPQLGTFASVVAPCVIRSEKPRPDLVRAVVGSRAIELSWATFAFQSMRDLDIQVLPLRVSCPRNVNEYDAAGKLVRPAAETSKPHKEDESPRKNLDERTYPSHRQDADVTPKEKSGTMLRLSVVMNIILAVLCAVLFLRKPVTDAPSSPISPIFVAQDGKVQAMLPVAPTNSPEGQEEKRMKEETNKPQVAEKKNGEEKPITAQLSEAEKAAIENFAIKQDRSKLASMFPSENVVVDFREAVLGDKDLRDLFEDFYGPKYDSASLEDQKKYSKANALLMKLKCYVDFVNNNLLKGKAP